LQRASLPGLHLLVEKGPLPIHCIAVATAVFTGFTAVIRKGADVPLQRLTVAIAEPLFHRCGSHWKAVAVAIENQNTNLIHTVNQHIIIFPLQLMPLQRLQLNNYLLLLK